MTVEYLVADRQHIVDAVVAVSGVEEGGQVNGSGLDWVVAEGLSRLGYRLVKVDG